MRIGKTLKKKTETYRRRPDSLVRFWRYINQHLLTYLFMTTTNTKCCFGAVGESDQRVEQPSDRALLRGLFAESSVSVSEEVDINRDAEDEKENADDNQHHRCRCNLPTTNIAHIIE